MDRRDFTLSAAASVMGLLVPSRYVAAADEAITFGIPLPMSGVFAAVGKFGAMGAQLYIDDKKELIGRQLNRVILDARGQPATAVRLVQDLHGQKGANFFAGVSLSSVALAVGDAVNKLGGVFATAAGADEITGTNCNQGTYRWSVPTYGAVQETIGRLIERYPDAKRWYTITPNYVFGQALLKWTKDILEKNNRELVGNSFHSLDETEFSSYIISAMATKPDVLVLLNFSAQSSSTLRDAVNFGVKNKAKIIMVWASGLEQFQALGADICDGVYFGVQYWQSIDSPGNKHLVQLTKEKLNITPNYSIAQVYAEMQMIGGGIEKAQSVDPLKVRAAMDNLTYNGPTGEETIRAADHQVIKNYYLLKGKPKSAMKDPDDYADILSFGKSFLSAEEAGCKMPQ